VSLGDLRQLVDDPAARAEAGAVAMVSAVLERIEAVQPVLNAYVAVRPDAALAEAEEVDRRRARGEALGPLAGVPVAVKDNVDVAGLPTTAGSAFLGDRAAGADAEVVRRLRAAGAIVVGKTGLHELAYGVLTNNPHHGFVRNPWDPERTPGGSSGGSAAALAADACVLALGSDTGGSVRIPAALCGVSGLRPTYGAVSVRGTVALSPSLDTVGPMARSVADVAALLAAIGGYDPADPWAVPGTPAPEPRDLGGLRIGLPSEHLFDGLEPDVERHVRAAAAVLAGLGAQVREIALPGAAAAVAHTTVLLRTEALATHRERLDAEPGRFGDDVRRRLELGREVTGSELAGALAGLRAWQHELARAFDTVDAILTPVTAGTAPRLDGIDVPAATSALTRLTYPWSGAGVPAASVPCGVDAAGLPIGVQLAAPPWHDAVVLRIAAAYQAATSWHRARPALDLSAPAAPPR
jgi:Asp-tRNA(Asn)/Glu-tRNA(Gln) amidotransferase A subunit family amidase